ncbi:MAG: hypothetical protein IPM06_19965 [Rhizobiales bacterium]|nr:hypothetical protein [Hyphomicrobiales bacterium]
MQIAGGQNPRGLLCYHSGMPNYYYFHADRSSGLKPGQVITLNTTPARFNTDRSRFLASLLPDGITQHGIGYLVEPRPQPYQDTNGLLEVLAEWIRQARYPQLPSRLQSFFAWRTLSEARSFVQQSALGQPAGTTIDSTIWEVEADPPIFESDMRRLQLGPCWLDAFIYLDSYWRQDYTATPIIEVLLKPPVRILRAITT